MISKHTRLVAFALISISLAACGDIPQSSDVVQGQQQETLQRQSDSAVGMPAITNFREKRLLKDILELRDQNGLITYTYIQSGYSGRMIFLGQTIGYGIPYSTQFTNPEKLESPGAAHEYTAIPQADPNGLFSPAAAEGTWVMMKDPGSNKVQPVYIEQRILVSPFPLPKSVVEG